MTVPQKIDYLITSIAAVLNQLATAAVLAMATLTTADVILRFFRRPIPGTYELIGFLGAVMISFSLAATSINRGHIAVDFLVRKLPPRAAALIDRLNTVICAVLFIFLTRYLYLYAESARQTGEASMTLRLPIYPIIYGITAGCGVLCAVLILQVVRPEADKNGVGPDRRKK